MEYKGGELNRMYRYMLASGDVDVEIPSDESDPTREAVLEAIAQLEQAGAIVRRRIDGGRELARAVVFKLHINCHVQSGQLTPEFERRLRDEFRDLYLESPGFLRWDNATGGTQSGPDTEYHFTATWATEDQAYRAFQQASGWHDHQGIDLGVTQCDFALTGRVLGTLLEK